ncbi:MAG: hypothetical protein Kapaf2KO_03440 [Candidatus Kapaibacteriales bacterium]
MVSIGQTFQASPANWMYPAGNAAAVRNVEYQSDTQSIDSMIVKWSTDAISGDVVPLIGNLINNRRLFNTFPFAPNEMVAAVNGEIVIVDGGGRVFSNQIDGDFIDRVSVLIDTLKTNISDDNRDLLVLGIETIENLNRDTLAYSYIVGYSDTDTAAKVIQRMAIDMRQYAPNYHASIKPFYGRSNSGDLSIYATVNSNQPIVTGFQPNDILPQAPYFRGITQFDANTDFDNYPFSDIGDDLINRTELGPVVSRGNISVSVVNGESQVLFPSYPTPAFDFRLNSGIVQFTKGNVPSLIGINISGSDINSPNVSIDGIALDGAYITGTRPLIENYWVTLWNPVTTSFEKFILTAEQYLAIEGSTGRARLQLFDDTGFDIATGITSGLSAEPILGGTDHGWSVAMGDIDGNASNQQLPFFPNNPGDELIVTQSTRDAAFPGSKLMVLKINDPATIPKPSPPNTTLGVFDTVFTQRISGWVAAVNDIDGEPDGKDEILVADNSRIMVLRAKDYGDIDFRLGLRLDTLLVREFTGETVSNASIADMDGDGKNDIVVTTFDRTYVIGAAISSVLTFTNPSVDSVDICTGDTLDLEWRNIIQSTSELDLSFVSVDTAGIPLDTISLVNSIPNPTEDVIYQYLVDTIISGKTGYFVISSPEAPEKVNAISALVSIKSATGFADISSSGNTGPNGDYYRMGEEITLNIDAACVDSVGAQISIDGTSWTDMERQEVPIGSGGNFQYTAFLPCLDSVFDISQSLIEEQVLLRQVSLRSGLEILGAPTPIYIRPGLAQLLVDTLERACSCKELVWNEIDFPDPTDSVFVMASIDGGASFQTVGSGLVSDEYHKWQVPLDLPDDITIRLATASGCVAIDTALTSAAPQYIEVVAPNPFNPYLSPLDINYIVPEDTEVTVQIFDQNDRLVAQIIENAPRFAGTAYCEHWDGLASDGNMTKNGLYYIKLTVAIGIYNIYPIFIHK